MFISICVWQNVIFERISIWTCDIFLLLGLRKPHRDQNCVNSVNCVILWKFTEEKPFSCWIELNWLQKLIRFRHNVNNYILRASLKSFHFVNGYFNDVMHISMTIRCDQSTCWEWCSATTTLNFSLIFLFPLTRIECKIAAYSRSLDKNSGLPWNHKTLRTNKPRRKEQIITPPAWILF